ncbi:hypothetical protein [Streptosporangium subroseum]|uniref:hypothetical protein n=1 Tax=Streptosporangium subroseum TaxID=106412 RepID=UPI00309312CC|nr:hypothetical protein OHB15_31490 [Streptosporangium subroseum]
MDVIELKPSPVPSVELTPYQRASLLTGLTTYSPRTTSGGQQGICYATRLCLDGTCGCSHTLHATCVAQER